MKTRRGIFFGGDRGGGVFHGGFSTGKLFKHRYTNVVELHAFLFISNTFISNARLKLVKIQANAKQHTEAELLPFKSYSHSSSTLSSKKNRTCSRK